MSTPPHNPRNVVGLTTLLSGRLDGSPCEQCGAMLPLWPTLLVRFPEANVVEVVQGSQFADAAEAAKESAGAEVHSARRDHDRDRGDDQLPVHQPTE